MKSLDSSPFILPLYLKAALPLVPGASVLPFVPGGKEIPGDLGFELNGVAPDQKRVAGYAKVCGFRLRGTLPPTFPHILAFPLQMAVMSDGTFPFGAVGLIHIENSISQRRPIGIDETLDLAVTVTPLEPHAKGRTFSLRTEVTAAGESVWSETSTMLRRGEGEQPTAATGPEPFPALDPDTPASANWNLAGDLGRRYATVSGDRNPIHMHSLTAKPLGFRSAIAHGMWTKARALAQLENRLPDSFTADARFRKPVFLPSRVEFASKAEPGSAGEAENILFTVREAGEGTPHLDGRIRPGRPDPEKASR